MNPPSLFDPEANDLGPFQRHSATSRRAAIDAYPRTGTQRHRVLEFIRGRGDDGATDDEIQVALNLNPSSERPRRIELVEGGYVRAKVVDGAAVERLTRWGSDAQVWVAE